jgi:hypothetical protein
MFFNASSVFLFAMVGQHSGLIINNTFGKAQTYSTRLDRCFRAG